MTIIFDKGKTKWKIGYKQMNQLYKIIFLAGIVTVFCACGVKKYIPEGEHLFTEVSIDVEAPNSVRNVGGLETELEEIIRPQAVSGFLGGHPRLRWHYKSQSEKRNFINKFLARRFGEEPVYISQVNLERNSNIILNRLENKGFFIAEVTHETTNPKINKGKIDFKVKVEKPYSIQNYQYEDPGSTKLSRLIRESFERTEVEEGMQYNLRTLQDERRRISNFLLENGYYYFTPDYLIFSMDTAAGDRQIDLYLQVKPNIPEESIIPYKIDDIYIFPDRTIRDVSPGGPPDTIISKGYNVVSRDWEFLPKRFDPFVLFEKGDWYRKYSSDQTRQRLFAIGAFGYVNVRHRKRQVPGSDTLSHGHLVTLINLNPLDHYSVSSELQVVSKSNNFSGPLLTGEFKNRNALQGGEALNFGLRMGYETQISGGRPTGLSAIEVGAFGELVFPRIIAPFQWRDNIKYGVPRTRLKLAFSVLDRVKNYQLHSANFEFGYSWSGNRYAHHEIKPVALTFTRLAKTSDSFEEILRKNPFLEKSFEQQFIPGMEYRFTFNELIDKSKDQHYFIQFRADVAGNLFNLADQIINSDPKGTLFGREFAHYTRFDLDFRYYLTTGSERRLVGRLFGGIGIPLGNSPSLPFIKQYFSGGPNSIRAFRIRSLGPGTYHPETLDDGSFFDQSGDIRIEANIEYRFPIVSIFKGAIFTDGGNIWLSNENEVLQGGKFSSDWYKELALGAGLGIRMDIEFLVVRLDLATPLRKPWLEHGDRWVSEFRLGKKEWRRDNLIWNIAIGYPF